MLIITALMKVKKGKADEFEKAARKYAPLFLKDPGCGMYRVQQRLDNPEVFLFYEQYEDKDALKYHVQSATFKDMKAATDPLLDGEPEIFRYKDILLS